MSGTLTFGPPAKGWPDFSANTYYSEVIRESQKVGVDLDGCVYDFSEALRRWLGLKPDKSPVTRWRFYEDWGLNLQEFTALCDQAVDAGFLFGPRSGPPMPGSLETMRDLRMAGHTLHIITDRSFGSYSQQATRAWLEHNHVPYDTIDFSADKTIRPTDFFIEDRPKNVAALREAGTQAFLLPTLPSREDQEGFLIARPEWGTQSWHDFYRRVQKRKVQNG